MSDKRERNVSFLAYATQLLLPTYYSSVKQCIYINLFEQCVYYMNRLFGEEIEVMGYQKDTRRFY